MLNIKQNNKRNTTKILVVFALMILIAIAVFAFSNFANRKQTDVDLDKLFFGDPIAYNINIPQTVESNNGPYKSTYDDLIEASIKYFQDGNIPNGEKSIYLKTSGSTNPEVGVLYYDANVISTGSIGGGAHSRRPCEAVEYSITDSTLTLDWKLWRGTEAKRCGDYISDGRVLE